MIIKITKFEEIKIEEETLLILDIDDTIIRYDEYNKEWWNKMIIERDIKEVENEWIKKVEKSYPNPTDKEGINKIIELNNKNMIEVIFLTSRHEKMDEITKKHLEIIGFTDIKIYYTNGTNKGKILKNVLEKYNNENIILIDDIEENIENVKKEIKNKKIRFYLFESR